MFPLSVVACVSSSATEHPSGVVAAIISEDHGAEDGNRHRNQH